jgi:hypothetical protein
MPDYGKFAPSPERYGGTPLGRKPTLRIIFEALNKARGTGYDTSEDSPVAAENFAFARAIWDVWETNQRMANVADPRRMSGAVLSRWERMFGIAVDPSETVVARRRAVGARFARNGLTPDAPSISDLIIALLGPVFVAIRHTPLAGAIVWWPGGTPNPDAPWYSTVARLLVKTVKPAGYTEQNFYDAVGGIHVALDPVLPSWTTIDWYRNSTAHLGGSLWADDPDAGFYLDDDHNLDNEVLDS